MTGEEAVSEEYSSFIFQGDKLLVKTEDGDVHVPLSPDMAGLNEHVIRRQDVGTINGINVCAIEVDDQTADSNGMAFRELRTLPGVLDERLFAAASRALQILNWEKTHQYCGRCGSATEPKAGELARVCPQCSLIIYPEVSPAIIVAVIRGHEILLARSHRFQTPFYSVLAGFVEPGETFEDTVRREVKEETGIQVGNIRYFGSQSWPFPNSFMVGFVCDYECGEIAIDESEIADAGWFTADNLPSLPRNGTIARRLIDDYIEGTKRVP
ncbi:MAG: NAD(+) diphosphatase [Nitrospirae bacterium]|nr:NAD(+) diphosphatase [Nitrospirota bacterium]